eukprot:gene16867-biopygen10628
MFKLRECPPGRGRAARPARRRRGGRTLHKNVVGKDSKGQAVPAFYAKKASQRERRDAAILDRAECAKEWPSFRDMLAEEQAKGRFKDAKTVKPKSHERPVYNVPGMVSQRRFHGDAPMSHSSCTYQRCTSCGLGIGGAAILKNETDKDKEGPEMLSVEQRDAAINNFRDYENDRGQKVGRE